MAFALQQFAWGKTRYTFLSFYFKKTIYGDTVSFHWQTFHRWHGFCVIKNAPNYQWSYVLCLSWLEKMKHLTASRHHTVKNAFRAGRPIALRHFTWGNKQYLLKAAWLRSFWDARVHKFKLESWHCKFGERWSAPGLNPFSLHLNTSTYFLQIGLKRVFFGSRRFKCIQNIILQISGRRLE